jgi:hypothetical protein
LGGAPHIVPPYSQWYGQHKIKTNVPSSEAQDVFYLVVRHTSYRCIHNGMVDIKLKPRYCAVKLHVLSLLLVSFGPLPMRMDAVSATIVKDKQAIC